MYGTKTVDCTAMTSVNKSKPIVWQTDIRRGATALGQDFAGRIVRVTADPVGRFGYRVEVAGRPYPSAAAFGRPVPTLAAACRRFEAALLLDVASAHGTARGVVEAYRQVADTAALRRLERYLAVTGTPRSRDVTHRAGGAARAILEAGRVREQRAETFVVDGPAGAVLRRALASGMEASRAAASLATALRLAARGLRLVPRTTGGARTGDVVASPDRELALQLGSGQLVPIGLQIDELPSGLLSRERPRAELRLVR